MKLSLKNESGFTLVETIVAVMLFTLLWGACVLIYISGSDSWQTNSVRLELHQEVRRAIARVTEDIRESGTGSITDVPADGNWYDTITFRKASSVSSGNIVWAANTTSYYVGGAGLDQLIEQTGVSTTGVAALDITSVQFRRQSATADIVEVNMVASKDTFRGRNLSVTVNFDIQLRNG